MKCLDDCHYYELDTFMGDEDTVNHHLRFYEMKENGDKIDGVTNEEVLNVLIDRIQKLNKKAPCRENSLVITKLEEARMWLMARTKDRVSRGVEGTHEK